VNAGEVVFRAGDPADALFIVARGSVEVVANSPGDAGGVASAELGPGTSFGEMGLLSDATRTAMIRTEAGADLLEIGREDFNALIASSAQPSTASPTYHSRSISECFSSASRTGPPALQC
jgi:CRP-like cAMP-binding protein